MSEYNPDKIELKWQKFWEEHNIFKTPTFPQGKKIYVLDMFPYPSGKGLHVGHPLGYTATDIFSRFKRMEGYTVLHPMGYDAFGLPAEQHAIATGEHPGKVTSKNCARFTQQLKRLGFSYDWSREIRTCDKDYYKWTQWIFLKIYNSWFDEKEQKAKPISQLPIPEEIKVKGEKAILDYQAKYRLAYYDDAMVNWCPALGTVLANEEVIDGKSERGGHEVIRKPMKQWLLRITAYAERLLNDLELLDWPTNIKEQQQNWIGRREGAEIEFKVEGVDLSFKAFTTRPDTLFGVTFFVVSPEHPLVQKITKTEYKKEVNEYIQKSLKLSDFERTFENRKKTGVFTGSYVINPINQERIPLYIGDYVVMGYGTGAVMGVPAHDERDFEFARAFRLNIRPVIIPETKDRELRQAVIEGEIAWTDQGIMLPIEDKVFVDLGLAGLKNTEASQHIVKWLEEKGYGRKKVNYRLKDWLFSRQRYWGEPIPIIHWEDGRVTPLSEQDLPLELPDVQDYKPSEGGESPLAKAKEWLWVYDKERGIKGRRETNTMPQWAGSCWYYLRFIDPFNRDAFCSSQLEKAWMPVDLYVGGAEHAVLHLLYARFWHKVLYDLGYVSTPEPFMKLFNQGMILSYAYKNSRGVLVPVDEVKEEKGVAIHLKTNEELEKITAKMSKSLRNVINPETVIEEYGADTLRLYLMFMGPLEMSRIWDSNAIAGIFRFLKRVYSFVMNVKDNLVSEQEESIDVKKKIHLSIKRVKQDIERLKFNTPISTLMECLNDLSKQKVSKKTVESFILLLSPFAPHLAEELWSILGNNKSVALQPFPSFDDSFLQEENVNLVIQVNGKKRAVINIPVDINSVELKQRVADRLANTPYQIDKDSRVIVVYNKKNNTPKLVNVILKNNK